MANILGIITAVALLASAFVAFKNKERLTAEIENRNEEIAKLEVQKDRLQIAQATAKALPIEIVEVDAEAASQNEQDEELKSKSSQLETAIESKIEEADAKDTQLADIREKTAGAGELEQLASNMKSMELELEELDQVITSGKATLANTTSQASVAQSEVKRRQTELDRIANGLSVATLSTSIRSVYPSWGFVTLGGGSNAGITASSPLNVVRGGEVVAKLLVSAVELSSASASVVPDSLGEGVVLRPGDRVVAAEKEKEETKTEG